MDFELPDELVALRDATRRFVADVVMPYEDDPRQTPHGPTDALRDDLVAHARKAGLLTPHGPTAYGGQALSHRAKAVVFEEAGYSPLGPIALNIHAPDEGNIHLLDAVATPAQRERYLRPLVEGHARSCFAMTEPAPGAGSDPSMLQTTATPDGEGWRIDGTKWFITGAVGARFVIVMARLPDGRATMFLTEMASDGIQIERQMDALDTCFTGGHAVVRFDGLRVGPEHVLGALGEGFRHAQVRLAPARLTHCMRWLGAARRAHDTAMAYAIEREAFGQSLARHEGVGFMLADNAMDLHAARLSTWHTAWVLDQGRRGGLESSMSKVAVSEAVWRVVDRSAQVLGGRGVTGESIVMRIWRDVRAFRIYDGPSEVHRWSIARKLAKHAAQQ